MNKLAMSQICLSLFFLKYLRYDLALPWILNGAEYESSCMITSRLMMMMVMSMMMIMAITTTMMTTTMLNNSALL